MPIYEAFDSYNQQSQHLFTQSVICPRFNQVLYITMLIIIYLKQTDNSWLEKNQYEKEVYWRSNY